MCSEFETDEARRAQSDLEAYNRDLEQQMEREKERQARNIEALNQRKDQMVKDKKAKLKVSPCLYIKKNPICLVQH